MMKVVLALLFLVSGLNFSVSESQSASLLLPHASESFNLSYIQNEANCSYSVFISTSCSSPKKHTTDQISIAFGDANGNEIYAAGLDDPESGTFKRCSKDTFQINGPCVDQICYLYLYRYGSDDWKPDTVKINGFSGEPVSFYYNTLIPEDTWFGFDFCNHPSSSYQLSTHKWLIYTILGFVLISLLF